MRNIEITVEVAVMLYEPEAEPLQDRLPRAGSLGQVRGAASGASLGRWAVGDGQAVQKSARASSTNRHGACPVEAVYKQQLREAGIMRRQLTFQEAK